GTPRAPGLLDRLPTGQGDDRRELPVAVGSFWVSRVHTRLPGRQMHQRLLLRRMQTHVDPFYGHLTEVRMPVLPRNLLSLYWTADWWSRWQKATPGIVPETTEDLVNVLISAFWRGDLTDAEPNERIKTTRLRLLRSLCDGAQRAFDGADIRTVSVLG